MIYKFPTNYINILAEFFAEIDKLILKLVWKWWEIGQPKHSWERKNKASNYKILNIYSKEIDVFLWLIHIVVQKNQHKFVKQFSSNLKEFKNYSNQDKVVLDKRKDK